MDKYFENLKDENINDKIKFVRESISNENYMILPETIAIGLVYKIVYQGSLSENGYEKGFLFIPRGSGIKEHKHIDDVEQYNLIAGILSVKGEKTNTNNCLLNETHNIDIVTEDTIIETIKISKQLIEQSNNKTKEQIKKLTSK